MKLFNVFCAQALGYSCVIVRAPDEATARFIHPAISQRNRWDGAQWVGPDDQPLDASQTWPGPNGLIVVYLGEAPAGDDAPGVVEHAHHYTPLPHGYATQPPPIPMPPPVADPVRRLYFLNTRRFEGYTAAIIAADSAEEAKLTHPNAAGGIVWDTTVKRWEYALDGTGVKPEDQWANPEGENDIVVTDLGSANMGESKGVKFGNFTGLGVSPVPDLDFLAADPPCKCNTPTPAP